MLLMISLDILGLEQCGSIKIVDTCRWLEFLAISKLKVIY